jgi:azurin
MKTSLRMLMAVVVLGVSLLLAACGGGGGGTTTGGGGAPAAAGPTTIEIATDGENLAFDTTTLSAASGQEVSLTFNNTSAFQQHNWVLVSGGESAAAEIATEGITAGLDADYLPAGNPNVLAHTSVLEGGESETITFTAPAAGTYLYICTVPGHYPLMQGTLTVN